MQRRCPLTGIAMDDIEQCLYDECYNGVKTMLEAYEKVYDTERLYFVVESLFKREIRPRYLAILLAEEREKVL